MSNFVAPLVPEEPAIAPAQPTADTARLDFEYPDIFNAFPHKTIWTRMEEEQIGEIRSLLPKIREFMAENGVTISHDLAGRKVYIGSHTKERLQTTVAKLEVLFYLKKTGIYSERSTGHILYEEGYKDTQVPDFYVDTRYMANVDRSLLTSTLLDLSTALVWPYSKVFLQGVTARLCPYDRALGYHTSLIGMRADPNQSSLVGPSRISYRPNIANKEMQILLPFARRVNLVTAAQIASWETASIKPGSIASTGTPSSPGEQAAGDLPSSLSQPKTSKSPLPVPKAASSTGSAASEVDLIDFGSDDKPGAGAGADATPRSVPPTSTVLPNVVHRTMRQQTGRSNKPNWPALIKAAMPDGPTRFHEDMDAAYKQVASNLEYLRGHVELRWDFGRIILGGMDTTALAFNLPGTRSNGWRKHDLLTRLQVQFKSEEHVHFTKLMTTNGQDMIAAMEAVDNEKKPLWSNSIFDYEVIYSLFCSRDTDRFIVEFQLDPHDGGKYRYAIRKPTDEKRVVWMHALKRDWDARLTMSHTDTAQMEEEYGVIAKMLLECLDAQFVPPSTLARPFSSGRPANLVPPSPDHSGVKHRLTFGTYTECPAKVNDVRVFTKWSRKSYDNMTRLTITEVQEMSIKTQREDKDRSFFQAVPWADSHVTDMAKIGYMPYWYELSVSSLRCDTFFEKNKDLKIGEKADYDFDTLRANSGPSALTKRVLLMLKQLDQVGLANNNNLARKHKLPPPNRQRAHENNGNNGVGVFW